MANGDKKTQLCPTGHRTCAALEPVSYQITLVYLGDDRIRREPGGRYNCAYRLQRGKASIRSTPFKIRNEVRGQSKDPAAVSAATPATKGGDSRNPSGDTVYRILITDNHALMATEFDLLGPNGDYEDKARNYQKHGWMADIEPAIPLRVVVRKRVGTQQVDFDGVPQLVVEIKDPLEEFDQYDGKPREFLTKYFDKHNRTRSSPDPGEDNAWDHHGGIRGRLTHGEFADGASYVGVKADLVLKEAPYAAPPKADERGSGNAILDFNTLTDAVPLDPISMRAKLNLRTESDAKNKKVGVADMVFCPPAIGGDNYRFLLTLQDPWGTDIRETQENNTAVVLTDDLRQVIPQPRAYTTGRFIVWRKVDLILVLVNESSVDDVGWEALRTVYQRAFIEIDRPETVHHVPPADWRKALREVLFGGQRDMGVFETHPELGDANYGRNLIPDVLASRGSPKVVDDLARTLTRDACSALRLPPPDKNTSQRNSKGLFIVLCHGPYVGGTVSGSYMGDRMAWFAKRRRDHDPTGLVAHEIGHALYLRHAHTSATAALYDDHSRPYTLLIDTHTNNFLDDHDQNDAFSCLMAYTRPASAKSCGMCNLTLRFYDRPAIQKLYGDEVLGPLAPVSIVRVRSVELKPGKKAPGTKQDFFLFITDPVPDLARNSSHELMALGSEMEFTKASPPPPGGTSTAVARINLSRAPDANWQVIPPSTGAVSIDYLVDASGARVPKDRVRVTGIREGTVTLKFWRGALSATTQLRVTRPTG